MMNIPVLTVQGRSLAETHERALLALYRDGARLSTQYDMFGFVLFNRDVIAAAVAKRAEREVRLGRMNWHADSYHIYGKDLDGARQRLFDRVDSTRFEDRVLEFSDPSIREWYDEAEATVRTKIAEYDRLHA